MSTFRLEGGSAMPVSPPATTAPAPTRPKAAVPGKPTTAAVGHTAAQPATRPTPSSTPLAETKRPASGFAAAISSTTNKATPSGKASPAAEDDWESF